MASSRAVCFPMPVLAPVTMTVFPGMVALLGQAPPETKSLEVGNGRSVPSVCPLSPQGPLTVTISGKGPL